MPTVGIVADDLTGGTTVGALLARRGVPTTVLFGRDDIERDAAGAGAGDAVVVSTDSRAMPPEVAFGRVRAATQALLATGATRLSKRIDTTCRGGIGPEVEGMLSALPDDHVAVVVPAMPQSRRIVVSGFSLIDSVLLARTDVAKDVRTPVTESHLPTLLRRQLTVPLGQVLIATVLAGAPAVAADLSRQRAEGARVFLVDATSLDDVETIAEAVVGLGWDVVCVDPGPFTEAMALRSGSVTAGEVVERSVRPDPEPRPGDDGTVVVVAGSATRVTHEQIARVRAAEGTATIGIDVVGLLSPAGPEAEEQRAVEAARRLAALDPAPRVVVVAFDSVVTGQVQDPAELRRSSGLTATQIATRLADRLGRISRLVADELGPGVAGFYLTGGDIMVRSVGALGARGVTLVDFVIPQVDQGALVGGPYDGLPVVCKGGLTGAPDTAVCAVNRIFDERIRTHVRTLA